ncbi:uroporphyrinogen-III C-methyltransferase [Halanaerocella petrolearia]
MAGKVYLVGAGPGDQALITIKGQAAIREADVVLYDRLANDNLLKEAREEAELFYVGKKSNHHYRTQEEINQLLIDKAQEGKIVTRLKGGDPFVFGRGGEEASKLSQVGIDFEIVPGITSPISVPAYAGIPVTNRNISSSVTFVTGHEDPTKEESSIDWDQLATATETLVILMGVGKLPEIAPKLMAAGRDPQTPVALIRWGTRPEQETLVGTLENIVAEVEENNFKPPAIIIVGKTVNLRQELNWFETRPLFSKEIVVTRPAGQATSFCQMLSREGAKVIEAPAIEILPPESYQELDSRLERLSNYDWVVFTSVNGVKYVMERLFALDQDVRSFGGLKICAIGSKTAAKLKEYGLVVDYIPADYVSESIIDGLSEQDLTDQRFLLPRANIARQKLQDGLEELGAEVDNITAYRTISGAGNKELVDRLKSNQVDLVTFTSSSTVRNFIKQLGNNYQELLTDVEIACIGPITAGTVQEYGLEEDIIADEYTIEGLIIAIKNYYNQKSKQYII